MAARTSFFVVYRIVTPEVWDANCIPQSRLAAYLEGGWQVLIGDEDIRQQAIEDEHARQTAPFNQPRMP
jgi:hypothetical protein